MGSGGARNRSGPPADPNSMRSKIKGVSLANLPGDGYLGEIPEFPLPDASERELDLWSEVWRFPQAEAWAGESWRWPAVAMWVRTFVVCEGSDATAADKGSLHRFADQIGLTPAGLKENGWSIGPRTEAAVPDSGDDESPDATVVTDITSARGRLRK